MNAVGCCGMQLYRYGQTVSLTFQDPGATTLPRSTYDKIAANVANGRLHTLCLLDIKMRERTVENLLRDRPIYEPPRFMTVAQGATLLMTMEAKVSPRQTTRVATEMV